YFSSRAAASCNIRREVGNSFPSSDDPIPPRFEMCGKETRVTLPRALADRIRHYGLTCGFLLLVTVVIIAGCGSGRVVLPVAIDPNVQIAPSDSRDMTNHERAVQGIAAILSKDLKLPMPERVTV